MSNHNESSFQGNFFAGVLLSFAITLRYILRYDFGRDYLSAICIVSAFFTLFMFSLADPDIFYILIVTFIASVIHGIRRIKSIKDGDIEAWGNGISFIGIFIDYKSYKFGNFLVNSVLEPSIIYIILNIFRFDNWVVNISSFSVLILGVIEFYNTEVTETNINTMKRHTNKDVSIKSETPPPHEKKPYIVNRDKRK